MEAHKQAVFLLMQCHGSISQISLLLNSFSICCNVKKTNKKNPTTMSFRITCFKFTPGMFQTGVFLKNSTMLPEVAIYLKLRIRVITGTADQTGLLKSAHSNRSFCLQGWIFCCLCSKISKPPEAGLQEQLPRVFWTRPGPRSPPASPPAVLRRGQGR